MNRHVKLAAAVLLCCMAAVSWAATTGKITGVIADAQTAQPIVGVTVSVMGTNLGAISDQDGRYNILNVPVGTYTLMVSSVGYSSVQVDSVAVSADLAAYQDLTMSPSTTELTETIRVTAKSPLVLKDKIGSITIVKREDLLALPTRGFEQLVGLQNSVVRVNPNISTLPRGGRESVNTGELNMRGGRPSEVAYYVDGFSQQDPLSGNSTANISNNAIKEVTVIAGGFPAEYGNVASGIVNVISNMGSDEYHGNLEVVTDNFASGVKSVYDQNYYSGDFGGPIPGLKKGHFFFSGERRWMADRSPSAITDMLPGEPTRLPSNSLDGWSYQGKLDYNFGPNTRLFIGANGSIDKWREYLHTYLFNNEHTPYYEDENLGAHGKLTHTFDANTFMNLSASYYVTKRFRGDGVHKDDLWAYGRPEGNTRFDVTNLYWQGDSLGTPKDSTVVVDVVNDGDTTAMTFVGRGNEGHVYDDYYKRESSYIGFKGDITRQMYNIHTVKAGFEFQRHSLRYYRALFPVDVFNGLDGGGFIDVDRYGYDFEGNSSDDQPWQNETKHPVNWAGFLQDRFEWSGMIISAGVRFDYYDYKAQRLRNIENPLDPDSLQFKTPLDPGLFTTLDQGDLEPSEKFTRVSPRLGVSFPISDKVQMHMNYGKFFQRPDLIRLYVGYDYFEKMVKLGGYSYQFGNPNLEPEKTTQYEIGLTRQLGDNAVVKFSAFYKDVTGLVQVYNQSTPNKNFESYRNSDYSTIKGLETQLILSRTNNVQVDVKYSLSFASGTGSYANTQSNISWTKGNLPKQTAPLSFDQRHNIVGVFDFRTRKGEGPKWGDFFLFENFGANAVVQAGSGTPYSPQKVFNEVTLAAISPIPDGPRNSQYSPWTLNIDLKVERTFNVRAYKLSAYVWIKNLLDRDNVYSVYEGTGTPDNTGWLQTDEGATWLAGDVATSADPTGYTGAEKYEFKENNPQNYGNPRQILAGLRFSF